ncbi:hypothetical protein MN202_04130 [Rheinheimera muenzenbergensis]|uniref:Uncharacterized protein n=1 Tax=Rheinheimera muenzenbergensis TaxID=1193628 RepID=A0ABU8C3B8_9GAMM
MKLLVAILTLMPCLALSRDVPFIQAPISTHLSSECTTEACNMTLCMANLQNNNLTIGSTFLYEEQLLVNGMLFYLLEDYIKVGSDIYSPWLKRDKMTDFFKENYLKRIETLARISFKPREEKCFNLKLDKSYALEDGRYYIGHYFLHDAYVLEIEKTGFFSVSSNIVVIQKSIIGKVGEATGLPKP